MLPDAFRGHGVFFYQPQEILDKFRNDTGRIVRALREAGMQHVWVRLHDHRLVPEPEAPTARLIAALREQKFALAGWGFVRGEDPVGEATAAAKLTKHHGLAHYVADIEQDEHDSLWTVEKIPLFLQTLRVELPAGAGIAVSSYPYVVGKHPELMRAAAPHADLFNPQIYWHHHPKASMLAPGNLPPDPSRPYGRPGDLHNPVVYADLCLDWWRATVGATPLLPAGQAYGIAPGLRRETLKPSCHFS
jgi:hypothetical protein